MIISHIVRIIHIVTIIIIRVTRPGTCVWSMLHLSEHHLYHLARLLWLTHLASWTFTSIYDFLPLHLFFYEFNEYYITFLHRHTLYLLYRFSRFYIYIYFFNIEVCESFQKNNPTANSQQAAVIQFRLCTEFLKKCASRCPLIVALAMSYHYYYYH